MKNLLIIAVGLIGAPAFAAELKIGDNFVFRITDFLTPSYSEVRQEESRIVSRDSDFPSTFWAKVTITESGNTLTIDQSFRNAFDSDAEEAQYIAGCQHGDGDLKMEWVTVPAGTYNCCKLDRWTIDGVVIGTYWINAAGPRRGIIKIETDEHGKHEIQELVSYKPAQ